MKNEIWRQIKGYEGTYKISSISEIKNIKTNRILKPSINGCGYRVVDLCNGSCKSFKVHLLVYDAFGKEKRSGRILQVDHIDNNKLNNHIKNLQLLTNRKNLSKYLLTQKKSSKYIGVYWNKKAKKWISQIRINRVRKYLGLFDNEYDAYLSYQKELQKII